MKKPRRSPKDAQLNLLRQVVGVLVSRMGGHVEVSVREINQGATDRVEVMAGPDGFVVHVHRAIKVVSSLN